MARADRTTLARRIKARRLALGLTQREVAGDDFTRGFISQVENGLIDPSLKSLEIIAQRLGSPMAYFLADPDGADPVVVEKSVRRTYELLTDDLDEAAASSATALSGAERLDEPTLLARARAGAAWVEYYKGNFSQASALFAGAADAHRTAGNADQRLRALNAAGSAAHRADDFEKAEEHYALALELAEVVEEPDPNDRLRVLVNFGLLLTGQNKPQQATELLEEALPLASSSRGYYRYGEVHQALGVNYRRLGFIDKAIRHYQLAFSFFEGVQEPLYAAHALLNCGNAYAETGDYAKARPLYEKIIGIYKELEEFKHAANAQAELALVAWHEGSLQEASDLAEAALEHLSDDAERGRMFVVRARVLVKEQKDSATAARLYREGLSLLGESERDRDVAEAYYELGDLLMQLGKASEASPYLARAADLYRHLKG